MQLEWRAARRVLLLAAVIGAAVPCGTAAAAGLPALPSYSSASARGGLQVRPAHITYTGDGTGTLRGAGPTVRRSGGLRWATYTSQSATANRQRLAQRLPTERLCQGNVRRLRGEHPSVSTENPRWASDVHTSGGPLHPPDAAQQRVHRPAHVDCQFRSRLLQLEFLSQPADLWRVGQSAARCGRRRDAWSRPGPDESASPGLVAMPTAGCDSQTASPNQSSSAVSAQCGTTTIPHGKRTTRVLVAVVSAAGDLDVDVIGKSGG